MQKLTTSERSQRLLRGLALFSSMACLSVLSAACQNGEPTSSSELGRQSQAIAGLDANRSVNAAGTVLNQYTTLATNVAANATSLQVGSVAALADGADALATGDLLLVIQMQGATLDTASTTSAWGSITALNGAGTYEFVEVASVNTGTNTISLSCALKNAYTVAGHTQVIRVPQYDTLTIAAGGTVVAPAWDGSVGGVVAVHAKNTVSLAGEINVTGLGFRGGPAEDMSGDSATDVTLYASAQAADGGRKGEGIGGLLAQYGRAPAGNGGGGGNSHNGGGGGGANARSGAAWTGRGTFDTTTKGGTLAWQLDPVFSATASEGGGRGGYTYSNSDQNALTLAPEKAAWTGNLRRDRGGLGGHSLDNDPAARVFFGGGGGAGDGNNGHAGAGGRGGGIVFVLAGRITGSGTIRANGGAGADANSVTGGQANGDAPGGGGGGGSVIIQSTDLANTISIAAQGGGGGNQIINNNAEAEGPGGGGGGGYVWISGTGTVNVAGGVAGTTSSPSLAEFPVNGATNGTAGLAVLAAANSTPVPYCVDVTAPDTTIQTSPNNPTSDTTGGFTFSSNDVAATYECSVDAAAYAACATPFTTAVLAPGSHTLNVRARDVIGNVDASPATYTWVVDTTAPDTSFSPTPPALTNDSTPTFGFSSNEAGATFQCRIGSAAFASCAASFTAAALVDGTYKLDVRAVDAAGNVDATPASHTFVVDTVAPDTTIPTKPAATTTQAVGSFVFASTETPATFQCKLDNAASFTDCSTPSPFLTASLVDGSHTLTVQATDAAGNTDATPAVYTWVIDTGLPDTFIDSGPSPVGSSTGATFAFRSDDPAATFECSLDSAAYGTCVAGLALTGLSEGPHQIRVRAKDVNGNVDATPATFSWTVDTTAPDTAIGSKPDASTTAVVAVFAFNSPNDAQATFECKLDAGAWGPCTSPSNLTALLGGSHTFQVRAKDAAGNTDQTPASYTWSVIADTDADGVPDGDETTNGTNPQDSDSDDDGVPDGAETKPTEDTDKDGLINALDPDSDNDGIFDGTESSVVAAPPGTDTTRGHFIADADPLTSTDPLKADTDEGGVPDGAEDPNHNGRVDAGERDPLNPADDTAAPTDQDGDGLTDDQEKAIGTNPKDADSDDDGVKDGAEPNPTDDTDGDGLINPLDPDSDDDGLLDGTELGQDCAGTGTDAARGFCVADADPLTTTSPLDPDTDGGGVKDGSEDANLNGAVDANETDPTLTHGADDATVRDTDGDGLSDGTEGTLGSDPADADTDDDGLSDGLEPNPSVDDDGDGLISVLDVDSDNDGLFDGTETGHDCAGTGTNAQAGHCVADADASTVTDPLDPDTDNGGVIDGSEDFNRNGKVDAGETKPFAGESADDKDVVDSDGDGLGDGTESSLGSDPNDPDSDDDGVLDGAEPNPSDDHDGDGKINVLDSDSDDDGLFDGTEVGVDCENPATDTTKDACIADLDPNTTTGILFADTDGGGVKDGDEDDNHNGRRDSGERDPLLESDDDQIVTGEGGAGGGGGAGGVSGATGGVGGEAGGGGETTTPTGGTSGGGGGTGGTGAATSGGTGGTLTGGATATGGATTAGATSGGETGKIVVLGGGFCAYRPPTPGASLASLLFAMLGWVGLRRRRR